jgi:hypothetical protein
MMKTMVGALLCALIATASYGQVIHDESINGDLSDDHLNPTPLTLSAGSNIIRGTTAWDPLEPDFFTVTIAADQTLTEVVLIEYQNDDDASFVAVEVGPQISSLDSGATLLGATLIGSDPGSLVGDDVLDDLGMAPWGGSGFMSPLGPGEYTFWHQETAGDTSYAFDFRVVPEPSTTMLMMLMGLFSLRMRRR